MKKIFTTILILLVLLITISCELFMQEPTAGKVYAIFVALDYENDNVQDSLDGTLNDANAQFYALEHISETIANLDYEGYKFLQEAGKPIDSFSIGNEEGIPSQPTFSNLKRAIEALIEITTENDLVIFTFSGHAKWGEIAIQSEIDQDQSITVAVSDILDLFIDMKGRKLIILDACETGLAIPPSSESSSTLLENSISKWYAKYFTQTDEQDRSLYVMSSSAGTDSYEAKFNGKSYGVFTQALLKGLGWDFVQDKMGNASPPAIRNGRLTTDSLLRYIKEHQTYPYKRSFTNTKPIQHPMISGGARDMVIFNF